MKKYQIVFRNNSAEKSWNVLRKNIPDALERCKMFLTMSPLDRMKSNGKLKKLRGELEGILQYNITDSARVRYEVDQKLMRVLILYVGAHPHKHK